MTAGRGSQAGQADIVRALVEYDETSGSLRVVWAVVEYCAAAALPDAGKGGEVRVTEVRRRTGAAQRRFAVRAAVRRAAANQPEGGK